MLANIISMIAGALLAAPGVLIVAKCGQFEISEKALTGWSFAFVGALGMACGRAGVADAALAMMMICMVVIAAWVVLNRPNIWR